MNKKYTRWKQKKLHLLKNKWKQKSHKPLRQNRSTSKQAVWRLKLKLYGHYWVYPDRHNKLISTKSQEFSFSLLLQCCGCGFVFSWHTIFISSQIICLFEIVSPNDWNNKRRCCFYTRCETKNIQSCIFGFVQWYLEFIFFFNWTFLKPGYFRKRIQIKKIKAIKNVKDNRTENCVEKLDSVEIKLFIWLIVAWKRRWAENSIMRTKKSN